MYDAYDGDERFSWLAFLLPILVPLALILFFAFLVYTGARYGSTVFPEEVPDNSACAPQPQVEPRTVPWGFFN